MIIFEFVDHRGFGVLTEWRRAELQVQQQAKLDAGIRLLRQYGYDLPPGLLAGPLRVHGRSYPHLYKLRLKGNVPLRPILCKGPVNVAGEVTFLIGAKERDWEFVPAGAPADAEQHRLVLVQAIDRRRLYVDPL